MIQNEIKSADSFLLELKNFKNFRENAYFRFYKGINVLEAPNASGKSSILSAIKLLFSENIIEEKLINNRSKPSEVKMSIGSLEQVITIENDNDNNQKIVAKDQSLIANNKNIDDVCIISEDHPIMKAAQLKDFSIISTWMNSLTDYSILKKMKDIADNVLVEFKTEKNKAESNLYARKKQLISLKNTLLSRKNIHETIYQSEISTEIKNDEYELLLQEEQELKKMLNNIETKIRKRKAEKDTLLKEKIKAEQTLSRSKEELKKILEIETSIPAKAEKIMEKIRKCKKINEKLDNEIQEISKKYSEKKRKKEDLEYFIEKKEHHCPTCYQEINIEILEKKLEDIENEKEELSFELNELKKQKDDNLARQKEWEKLYNQTILDTPEQKSSIKRRISQQEMIIRQTELKVPKLSRELSELEREFNELDAKYKEIHNKTIKIQDDFEAKNKKIADLRSKLEEINEQLNQINEEISRIDVQTKELSFYDIYIERIEKLSKVIVEKIDFIQFEMIDQINDELEILSKELNFNEIKEIYIDDNFNLVIIKSNSEPISYSDLSMFERKTIGVIIILVMKNLFAESFPILAIDEYLNSLDEERDMSIIDYLKNRDLFIILTKSTTNAESNNSQILTQENIKQLT